MREFYVYIMFRDDGSPCYVGKGRGRRWMHHFRSATNRRLRRILVKAGGEVPIVKIRENLTEAQAFEVETALIKAIGRKPYGPLVNLTEGGEGTAGSRSDAVKRRMRESHWSRKEGADKVRASIGRKGRVFTPEWRANLRKAKRPHLKGPISEKRREAIRVAVTAFWASRRAEAIASGKKVSRLGWDQH